MDSSAAACSDSLTFTDGPDAKVLKPPAAPPSKPRDHEVIATMVVQGTLWVGKRIHPTPKHGAEEVREGVDKWAEALRANFPELKAGPIMLAFGALVWSLGIFVSHLTDRALAAPKRQPTQRDENGKVIPEGAAE